MRKISWLTYLPYGVAVLFFVIATFWDYQIDAYLYSPQHALGFFFERFVLIPITMMVPIACYAQYRVNRTYLFLMGYIVSSMYVMVDAAHYWVNVDETWMILFLVFAVLTFILYLLLQRIPLRFWTMTRHYLLYVLVVFLLSLGIMIILKQCWGRVRYREMLQDVSQFTPWYLPQGQTGHVSFPSGHTTVMSVILCTLDAYHIKRSHPPFSWHYVLVFGLILMMMAMRMMVGAHFLSDVTMGFCITYTVFLVMRRKFYREDMR